MASMKVHFYHGAKLQVLRVQCQCNIAIKRLIGVPAKANADYRRASSCIDCVLASPVLRLWAARAAILDRIAAVSWPCDEFLQERITILDDREQSLKGLIIGSQQKKIRFMQHRNG